MWVYVYGVAIVDNDNYTGIEYQKVNELSNTMATVLSQQNKLISDLGTIDVNQENFDKIGKINAALEEQSEISELGIIPSLEKLYKTTKDMPHILKRVEFFVFVLFCFYFILFYCVMVVSSLLFLLFLFLGETVVWEN